MICHWVIFNDIFFSDNDDLKMTRTLRGFCENIGVTIVKGSLVTLPGSPQLSPRAHHPPSSADHGCHAISDLDRPGSPDAGFTPSEDTS